MLTVAGEVRTYAALLDRDVRGCGGADLDAARAEALAITDDLALVEGWQRTSAAVVEFSRPVGSRFLHRTTAAYERRGH